ncbi:hypothetical protein F5880DRAFT_1494547, partial [Lentinula raphanica]
NYNTEMFERLHIDFAKKGWRASNKREEFPQMTKWLARQENVQTFNKELSWILEQQRLHHESQTPSPGSSRAEVEGGLVKSLPFNALDVYYSFKFSPETLDDDINIKDVVKASPLQGGRFDTVVVLTGDSAETTSFSGTRIGRVKVLFRLPSQLALIGTHKSFAPSWWPSSVLAYVEWFSPPSQTPIEQKSHNMTTVHKLPLIDGIIPWSIIPLSNIRQSCMLMPRYDRKNADSSSWNSSNILDTGNHFLVNNWSSLYTYKTLYKE